VAALEVVVVAAHAHAGYGTWRNREVVDHVLPTDKVAAGLPGATAAGICAVLSAYAILFVGVAALRRGLGRAGRVAEVLLLALPTACFLSFTLAIGRPPAGSGPDLLRSAIVAILWAPGALTWVWLLVHPVLAVFLLRLRH
jgi:hypothetical protein